MDYIATMPATPGHYVYRCWAADDSSLYVGAIGLPKPRRPAERFREHAVDHHWWWPDVARIDFAICETPGHARAEEAQQISLLNPVHNKIGTTVAKLRAQARAKRASELLALTRRRRDLLGELATVDAALSVLKSRSA